MGEQPRNAVDETGGAAETDVAAEPARAAERARDGAHPAYDPGDMVAEADRPGEHDPGPREHLLEIEGLSKSFGPVRANRDITMRVDRGEIVALLGENGAGKSTLVKQIFGLIAPDSGTIRIKGDVARIKDPKDAIRRGIGMVHQHFQLVPVMTVAENVILGHETTKGGRLDLERARTMVRALSERHSLSVDPDVAIEDLPVGTQQRVEILKALSRKVDLLILDEPTAVLTPQETDELLSVMKELAASGTSIVFITHKLREVLAVADRVYVLRQGAQVGQVDDLSSTTTRDLASLMVGREVVLQVEKDAATPGEEVLTVHDLHVRDDRGLMSVDGFSLTVRAGEIVGVAGVEGNGQRELVECIAGMRPAVSGQMSLSGNDITKASPRQTHVAGVGHVPEDREKHGLVSGYSVADNLVLNRFSEPPFASGVVRQFGAVRANAEALREEFDIRMPSVDTPAGALSGGNKQKVVVAREMSFGPSLLMAAQPTRGVDVGSIEFIHKRIIRARDEGAGVLLVSAELDEILSLSDRIAVIHSGRVVAEMPAAGADRTEIGRLMAGDH